MRGEAVMLNTAADYIFYQTHRKPPLVDRAEGIRLWDTTGKEYIYEIVNDPETEGFNKWTVTYNP